MGRLLAFTARGVLRPWLCRGFIAGWLLFHGIAGQAALPVILDLNGNGISDVWESLHQTEALALDFDSDGDGMPNRSEAMAGTDPRNAQSVPRINGYGMTTNGFVVSMRGALGKRMELQSAELTPSGAGPVWTAEGSIVARTNADVVLIAPADRPSKIFRMSVSDVDTDGDGLNDWEEYQLRLNPFSATSNGRLDNRGNPMSDLAHVTSRMASQSLASLLSSPAAALGSSNNPLCGLVAASAEFPLPPPRSRPGPASPGCTSRTPAPPTPTRSTSIRPTIS